MARVRFSVALLALFLPSAALAAQTQAPAIQAHIQAVVITDPGIYTANVVKRIPSPALATGEWSELGNAILVRHTTTVPAQPGLCFGFYYTILGAPVGAPVTLRMVNRYPGNGLADPTKAAPLLSDTQDFQMSVGATNYRGYTFENNWELALGRWTFEIWDGTRLLATQTFDVVPPVPAKPPQKKLPECDNGMPS